MSRGQRVESQLVRWWEGKHYPDAGELIGWRVSEQLPRSHERRPSVFEQLPKLLHPEDPGPDAGSAREPTRDDESNRERAARRARTRLRRYAVANQLRYMWVLTFAPVGGTQEHDLGRAKRATAAFVRRALRRSLGYRGAYVLGWERHQSGAWHVNVLIGARLEHADVARAWALGNVWVSRFRSKHGESGRDASRRAAAYVAKYVSKEFLTIDGGVHRYEVAQGFAVRLERVFALSATGLLEAVGLPVVYRFDAPAAESGRGPPIVWAAFGELGG